MASLYRNSVRRNGKRIVYPTWYGSFKNAEGKWERVKLFTDKDASQSRLAEIQKDADRRRAGVHTADMDAAARPLSEHLADYVNGLRVNNLDADHIRIVEWSLGKLVKLGGWSKLSDVTADSMQNILHTLERQGKTVSYRNRFLSTAKAFIH